MKPSPEIEQLIDMLAMAKLHLLVVVRCPEGSAQRAEELRQLGRMTARARAQVDGVLGGIRKLPEPLAIALRVCEKGCEKLGGPAAPPIEGTRA